jgi:benzoate-CoA ligase family protein
VTTLRKNQRGRLSWELLIRPNSVEYNRPWMSTDPSYFNLCEYFLDEKRLRQIGERQAIEFRDQRVTFNDLRKEVDIWADQILRSGVNQGDRVALLLYDSPVFIACFLAAVSVGAVCVPINTFLPAPDIEYILSDSGARLVIVESELAHRVSSSAATGAARTILSLNERASTSDRIAGGLLQNITRTTRESPAFLLYTSGSTGTPKGVLHNHGSIPFTVESYAADVLRLTSDDRVFSSSRMFFAYGLGNSLSFPLAAGATVLLESERMSSERLARFIEERAPTIFFGVPVVYRSLLDYRLGGGRVDLSSVRFCGSAGEALPAALFEDWKLEFGSGIVDGIGSTEMLHIFISNREGKQRAGTSGTIVDGYDARLLDDRGDPVVVNELGNLWVRGGSATAGYWNLPELTEQTVNQGWVRTGDVYRLNEDGFYFHIGRSDDCFKVKGLWVSPIEVESVLISHEAVSEAAVVSSVDETGLATAWAYVVIRQVEPCEALKEEIRRFARSRLPQYKVPTEIEFIDKMPRTSTGKLQRYKLRADSRRP